MTITLVPSDAMIVVAGADRLYFASTISLGQPRRVQVRKLAIPMTEKEWLECDNSEKMVEFVRSKTTKRKLQLFAGASFRRLVHLLPDVRQSWAIELLENAPLEIDVQVESPERRCLQVRAASKECTSRRTIPILLR